MNKNKKHILFRHRLPNQIVPFHKAILSPIELDNNNGSFTCKKNLFKKQLHAFTRFL